MLAGQEWEICVESLREQVDRFLMFRSWIDGSCLLSAKLISFSSRPSFFQDFCNHFFRLFDKEGRGYLVQEEWIATLKENTR